MIENLKKLPEHNLSPLVNNTQAATELVGVFLLEEKGRQHLTPLPSLISRPNYSKTIAYSLWLIEILCGLLTHTLCMILLSVDTYFLQHAEYLYFTSTVFFFSVVLPNLTILVCRVVSCQHISLIHTHTQTYGKTQSHIY